MKKVLKSHVHHKELLELLDNDWEAYYRQAYDEFELHFVLYNSEEDLYLRAYEVPDEMAYDSWLLVRMHPSGIPTGVWERKSPQDTGGVPHQLYTSSGSICVIMEKRILFSGYKIQYENPNSPVSINHERLKTAFKNRWQELGLEPDYDYFCERQEKPVN